MSRAPLDAFLAAHGPVSVDWTEGWLRPLRWGCAALAAIILLGFTQFAEVGLAVRFVEVALGVALLFAFVWLRRATPAGGGLRVDADGLRVLPDGPDLPPEAIEAIALDDDGRAIALRTRAEHRHAVPLRVRFVGHEGRVRLTEAIR